MGSKGFVTLATGKEEYYIMAYNLLMSYKLFSSNPMNFAIVCDRENEYTKYFDDVVILQNSTKSYMDKLLLLKYSPYDENIFIDADCLAYADLNEYWKTFDKCDDFSCYGSKFSIKSKDGMFSDTDIDVYKSKVSYSILLHGVIYFIRKGEKCNKLYSTCLDIISNYNKLYFKGFEKPADEPVLALAMALHNFSPVQRKTKYYVFFPMAKTFRCDISKGILSYSTFKDQRIDGGMLVHWGNVNIKRRKYKVEILKMKYLLHNNKNIFDIYYKSLKWLLLDFYNDFNFKVKCLISSLKSFVYKVLIKFFNWR